MVQQAQGAARGFAKLEVKGLGGLGDLGFGGSLVALYPPEFFLR
jgi:hypothetical protein